jgi:hypothetical protein
MSHESDLKDWLEAVSEDSGVDVSTHLPALVEHGLTKFLLNDIPTEDWCEIVKPVGARIIIRRAAGNVYLNAELKNLQSFSARLREEREAVVSAESEIRSNLEKSQLELSRIDADLERQNIELRDSATAASTAADSYSRMVSERDNLSAEVEKINAEIEAANLAKEAAVKEKEDAINRAIQLGVSGQNSVKAPAGYAFQGGAPPPQQQQQQQMGGMGGMPPQQQQQMQGGMGMQQQQQPMMGGGMQGMRMQQQQQQPGMVGGGMQQAPPGNKVKPLEAFGWYHGAIGRPEAEAMLLGGACGPGSFLVRVSSRGDNSYSLSARESMAPRVKHFKIEPVGPQWKLGLKISDGQVFPTIPQLISYYKSLGDFSGVKLAKGAPKAGGGGGGMQQRGGMSNYGRN